MDYGLSMILIAIVGLINLVVFLDAAIEDKNRAFCISGIIGIVLIIAFFYIPIRVEKEPWERPTEAYVTQEIMCLADNTMMTGRIYLRSGYIEENHHYLFGYRTASGGMKTQKVRADKAVVYFSDSITPCAKWYKETQRWAFFTSTRITCDIYVPTDSLIADYTIDLQ